MKASLINFRNISQSCEWGKKAADKVEVGKEGTAASGGNPSSSKRTRGSVLSVLTSLVGGQCRQPVGHTGPVCCQSPPKGHCAAPNHEPTQHYPRTSRSASAPRIAWAALVAAFQETRQLQTVQTRAAKVIRARKQVYMRKG